jgi:hypothetical protein
MLPSVIWWIGSSERGIVGHSIPGRDAPEPAPARRPGSALVFRPYRILTDGSAGFLRVSRWADCVCGTRITSEAPAPSGLIADQRPGPRDACWQPHAGIQRRPHRAVPAQPITIMYDPWQTPRRLRAGQVSMYVVGTRGVPVRDLCSVSESSVGDCRAPNADQIISPGIWRPPFLCRTRRGADRQQPARSLYYRASG